MKTIFKALSIILIAVSVCSAEEATVDAAVGESKLQQVQKIREQSAENGGTPALAKWKGSNQPSMLESGGKMFSGLALCVGLLLVGTGVYKRLRGIPSVKSETRMKVIERMSLTPKTSVVLFELRGKEYLAAVGGENVSFANTQESQPLSKAVESKVVESKGFDLTLQEACVENTDKVSFT